MAFAAPAPRVLADFAARNAVTQIALVLGGAAFVAVSAQIAIPLPFTPVPLTLQTFAVLLTGAALGSLRGVLAMTVYALVGMAGAPIYSQGASGFGGATFGYILGFILAAFIVGRLAEGGATTTPWRTTGLMLIGNIAIYAVGVTWLKVSMDFTWSMAIALGATPFLIGDVIKIALAAGLLPLSWKGLDALRARNNG